MYNNVAVYMYLVVWGIYDNNLAIILQYLLSWSIWCDVHRGFVQITVFQRYCGMLCADNPLQIGHDVGSWLFQFNFSDICLTLFQCCVPADLLSQLPISCAYMFHTRAHVPPHWHHNDKFHYMWFIHNSSSQNKLGYKL